MISGNIIIAFFVMQYTLFGLRIFTPKERSKIINTNIKLDNLRKVETKTIKEQKEFIKLKYGTKKNTKFNIKSFLKDNLIVIILFLTPYLLLQYSNFRPDFFITLLISIIISFIINKILGIWNLQKQEELQTLFR